jgi:uncharacterized membrane protein
MSGLSTYLRKTLVGGILVVLPVVVFVNVVIWIGEWIGNQSTPVAQLFSGWLQAPLWMGKTLAILMALALCFALGVFVGNRFGHRVFVWFESRTLGRLPGYRAIKEVVEYFGKNDRNPFARPVLVRLSDSAAFTGFLSDERGEACTVFIPTGPNPTTGLVVHVHASQVTRLGAPGTEVAKTIIACGAGSQNVLQTRRVAG